MAAVVEQAFFDHARAVNNYGNYVTADVPYFVFGATEEDNAITDALETFVLLNLELSLTGERKTFGEMSDIVRERLNAEKPEPQTWVIQ